MLLWQQGTKEGPFSLILSFHIDSWASGFAQKEWRYAYWLQWNRLEAGDHLGSCYGGRCWWMFRVLEEGVDLRGVQFEWLGGRSGVGSRQRWPQDIQDFYLPRKSQTSCQWGLAGERKREGKEKMEWGPSPGPSGPFWGRCPPHLLRPPLF